MCANKYYRVNKLTDNVYLWLNSYHLGKIIEEGGEEKLIPSQLKIGHCPANLLMFLKNINIIYLHSDQQGTTQIDIITKTI